MPYGDKERQKRAQQDWYVRNKSRIATARQTAVVKEAKSRSRVTLYQSRLAYVNLVKSRPCTDCGTVYPPCVMDLDHVRGTKIKAVSRMLSDGSSLRRIEAEIAKCDVVCANCHRLRTAARKKN